MTVHNHMQYQYAAYSLKIAQYLKWRYRISVQCPMQYEQKNKGYFCESKTNIFPMLDKSLKNQYSRCQNKGVIPAQTWGGQQ